MFCSICIRIRTTRTICDAINSIHWRFIRPLLLHSIAWITYTFVHVARSMCIQKLHISRYCKWMNTVVGSTVAPSGIHNVTCPFVLVNELRCSNFDWNALKWQLFGVECWRWRRGQWNKMQIPIDLCAACLRLPAHTSIYWVLHLIAYKQ